MIKIKLECWWTNTNSINERFINQYISKQDFESYCLVENDPDYTIVFGKTNWDKLETPKDKTFFFTQEPLFSPNEERKILHEYCSKIFIADKRLYPNKDEYIETLVPMFYGGSGESDYREEFNWDLNIVNRKFSKSKNISCIISQNYSSYYDSFEKIEFFKINNKFRTDLSISLSQETDIHIYGRNCEKIRDNVFGDVWNKHVALNDYKFSVCAENCLQKNYISEKFWDCILTDTVPIYLGCSNIEDYIPKESFININNKSPKEIIEKIKEIDLNADKIYLEKKEFIQNLKQEYFKNSNYNLWEKIKFEINNN